MPKNSTCQTASTHEKTEVDRLTKLLRDGLRDVRFSIQQYEERDTQLHAVGSSTTMLKSTKSVEHDSAGLRSYYQAGDWKEGLFRANLDVNVLPCNATDDEEPSAFTQWLNDVGVLHDHHVAHVLGPSIPGTVYNVEDDALPNVSVGIARVIDLWHYALIDACIGTPRRTATKFVKWANGVPFQFETCVLLTGLRVSETLTFKNGIRVQQLPSQTSQLGQHFQSGAGIPATNYLRQTMLRIPTTLKPALSRPISLPQQVEPTSIRWGSPQNAELNWPLADSGIPQLARSLSLVCGASVEAPVIWANYSAHTPFGHLVIPPRTFDGNLPIPQPNETRLTRDLFNEALRLQPTLCNSAANVETAIHYWLKSKAQDVDLNDAHVFLRTALESLFLNQGNRHELSFQLALRGAWYTGRNPSDRQARQDDLSKFYDAASGAVHSGEIRKPKDSRLVECQEICRFAILKRLQSEQEPVWNDIIFGL